MASLNQISESIAISFDQQNNEVFKDNVKFRVKQICALLIEREMKQEGYGNMMYIQKYEAELEKVDATDSCLSSVPNSDCIILKTKNKNTYASKKLKEYLLFLLVILLKILYLLMEKKSI